MTLPLSALNAPRACEQLAANRVSRSELTSRSNSVQRHSGNSRPEEDSRQRYSHRCTRSHHRKSIRHHNRDSRRRNRSNVQSRRQQPHRPQRPSSPDSPCIPSRDNRRPNRGIHRPSGRSAHATKVRRPKIFIAATLVGSGAAFTGECVAPTVLMPNAAIAAAVIKFMIFLPMIDAGRLSGAQSDSRHKSRLRSIAIEWSPQSRMRP
jgi:hypothetical protein